MRRVDQKRQLHLRTAFTLVEMLVAVALISILMLMFAQIFSLASEILSQQRGIAANDQTERQLRTVFRDDLNHRTFTKVTPYATANTTGDSTITEREGYFHISEGSLTDDKDDVLQLTLVRGANEDPFYGHAVELAGFPIGTHPNQPEFDDQLSGANSVGSSSYAEVVYFMRPNGNLYRRVSLLREPIISTNDDPTKNADGLGGNIITAPYANEFWNDFDYSGYYDGVAGYVKFLGAGARVNDDPATVPLFSSVPISLGVPKFRWGFDLTTGQPRAKVTDTSAVEHFIGRFTQQETSDPAFDYPGSAPGTSWFDPTVQLDYDSTNGVLTALNDGPRVSEDILLRNVHSFDIKVWDPAVTSGIDTNPGVSGIDDDGNGTPDDSTELGWPGSDDGDWRDIGHSDANGFYRSAANQNTTFGEFPVGAGNGKCYDTWHPVDNTNGAMPGPNPAGVVPNLAPYRPVLVHAVNGNLPQPLTMIRIHIRYVDQKSDQMRDVIIVHSLTD